MQKQEIYKFSLKLSPFSRVWRMDPELVKIAISNRIAKKICRKCYRRLPLNSKVCRNCKNPDLRINELYDRHPYFLFDKNTKNRLIEKRNVS